MKYVELLRSRPIAIETATANEQHYEVGTGVLQACLGPRMKYSSCLYPKGSETLAQAEIAMLETYVQKAQLKDGMSILDLGLVSIPSLFYVSALTDLFKMWLGVWSPVLCGGASEFQGHGFLEFEDAEDLYRQ